MAFPIFGNISKIALPSELSEYGLHGNILYTDFKYDVFYSKYGFAIPLFRGYIPLDYILENKSPLKDIPGFEDPKASYKYILVTRSGEIFLTEVDFTDGRVILTTPIYTSPHSWWVIKDDIYCLENEYRRLRAFLYTNPAIDKIEDYIFSTDFGSKIKWMTIDSIVENLNTLYPES